MRGSTAVLLLGWITIGLGCRSEGPIPLPAERVECAQCRMVITDPRFAAQVRTLKGRVLFFDSVECARAWAGRPEVQGGRFYLRSFLDPPRWLAAEDSWILEWQGLRSPMGRGWAAFASEQEAMQWLEQMGTGGEKFRVMRWAALPPPT